MSAQEGRKHSVATIDSTNSDHMTIITDGVRFTFRDSGDWESSRRDSLTASLRGAADAVTSALAQGTSGENTELLTTAEETLQAAITEISHCDHKPMEELPDDWTRWYDTTPVSSRRPSHAPSAHGTAGAETEASAAQSSEGAQSGEPAIQTAESGSITVVSEGLEIIVRNSEDASNTELEVRARPGWAAGRATAMRSAASTLFSPVGRLVRIVRKPKTQTETSTSDRKDVGIMVTTETTIEWSNPDPFSQPAGDDQNEETVFDGTRTRTRELPQTEGVPPDFDGDDGMKLDMTILSSDGA